MSLAETSEGVRFEAPRALAETEEDWDLTDGWNSLLQANDWIKKKSKEAEKNWKKTTKAWNNGSWNDVGKVLKSNLQEVVNDSKDVGKWASNVKDQQTNDDHKHAKSKSKSKK